MVLQQVRGRLQGLLRRYHDRLGPAVKDAASDTTAKTRRRARHQHEYYRGQRQTTGLDIARFGLVSIATLPFSLWVAAFTYDYYNRVPLCKDSLAQEDDEISYIRAKGKKKTPLIGRGRQQQLAEVRELLSNPPHQIVIVAGTNESGKSRFVEETLRSLALNRGITYIQLAQIVDSLSTLTHAFVRAFDLRWLQMRHSLVDVLPFAGSEILVMKERFSDRDLSQALLVITEALKTKASLDRDPKSRPVIVIDGLGEGSAWIRSAEGRRAVERLIKWCIYVTKERKLAHVVLTGNEELVISLTGQNRLTRGHVKVVGLDDLSKEEAAQIVLQELPDATPEEILKITDMFGGFIHDVQAVSREVQSWLNYRGYNEDIGSREKIFEDVVSSRFRLQMERVTAAFAKGRSETDESGESSGGNDQEDDMDPYLDPLKAIYSEAEASQKDTEVKEESYSLLEDSATWSQLQLWNTLERMVESDDMKVPFADLRDDIFDGNTAPLIELMHEDVLGFEVESSSQTGWSWAVKPATPALGCVFKHLVSNSHLKERFSDVQQVKESRDKIEAIEREQRKLRRDRLRLDSRKASLLKTVELEKGLRVRTDRALHKSLASVYFSIAAEEVANERKGQELQKELDGITRAQAAAAAAAAADENNPAEVVQSKSHHDHSAIRRNLKAAVLRTHAEETSKERFTRFRRAYEQLTDNDGGFSAVDVVRLIKEATGEEIDLEAAKSFIRTWDVNQDKRLDYDEFIRMLLTDRKATGNDAKKK